MKTRINLSSLRPEDMERILFLLVILLAFVIGIFLFDMFVEFLTTLVRDLSTSIPFYGPF